MKQTEVDFELTNGAWAAAAISPYLINDLPPDLYKEEVLFMYLFRGDLW